MFYLNLKVKDESITGQKKSLFQIKVTACPCTIPVLLLTLWLPDPWECLCMGRPALCGWCQLKQSPPPRPQFPRWEGSLFLAFHIFIVFTFKSHIKVPKLLTFSKVIFDGKIIAMWSTECVLRKKLKKLTVIKLRCQSFHFLRAICILATDCHQQGEIYFSSNSNSVATVIRSYSCDACFSEECRLLSVAHTCECMWLGEWLEAKRSEKNRLYGSQGCCLDV